MKFIDLTGSVLRRPAPPKPPIVHADPGGVIVGHAIANDRPIDLPMPVVGQLDNRHTFVSGASGFGKTALLLLYLIGMIVRMARLPLAQRPAIIIWDPKGDLDELDSGIAANCVEMLGVVTAIDPLQTAVPLNLCRLEEGILSPRLLTATLVDLVNAISSAGNGVALGNQQIIAIGAVIEAVLHAPGSNLHWAAQAFQPDGIAVLAGRTTSDTAREALLGLHLTPELAASCRIRLLQAFGGLGSEAWEASIGAPDCLSFLDMLLPGRITRFCLGNSPGALEAPVKVACMATFKLVLAAIQQRVTPFTGTPAVLVLDECAVVAPVIEHSLENTLSLTRSRGAGLVLATQSVTQLSAISPTLLSGVMTNCAHKVAGRVGVPAEALHYARALADSGLAGNARDDLARALLTLPPREFVSFGQAGSPTRFLTDTLPKAHWLAAAERHADTIAAARSRHIVPASHRPTRLFDVTSRQSPTNTDPPTAGRRSHWG